VSISFRSPAHKSGLRVAGRKSTPSLSQLIMVMLGRVERGVQNIEELATNITHKQQRDQPRRHVWAHPPHLTYDTKVGRVEGLQSRNARAGPFVLTQKHYPNQSQANASRTDSCRHAYIALHYWTSPVLP
jgi:hypothetical protein